MADEKAQVKGQTPEAGENQDNGGLGCCIGIVVLILINFVGWIIAFALMGSLVGVGDGNSMIGGSSSTSFSQCTNTKLTDTQQALIAINSPTYILAAEATDVPWQFLAALHFRESGLSVFQSKDGPFQVQRSLNFAFGLPGTIEAAYKAKGLAKGSYGVNLTKNSSENDLKLAFLAYNRGVMYKRGGCSVDSSPYVMNQFDTAHTNMRWNNNSCDPVEVRGAVNNAVGAFTAYVSIIGCDSTTSGGTSAGSGQCTWAAVSKSPRNMVNVEIKVWTPQKATKTISLRVHQNCAGQIKNIFDQIYKDPSKPPINGVSCQEDRPNKPTSRHNWGVACDINVPQNFCWNCYAKKSGGSCGNGSNIGTFWKPGDITPDKNLRGWSSGQDPLSIPINGVVSSAFKTQGWGRGLYSCFMDYMHFSLDGH